MTVHVLNVSFTVNPIYSLTNQKPASLTWENISEPAPVAMTSNSKLTPVILATTGETIPAAVVKATVAEPVAIRINPATRNASTSGDNDICSDMDAMAVPTPLSIKICLKPPPLQLLK